MFLFIYHHFIIDLKYYIISRKKYTIYLNVYIDQAQFTRMYRRPTHTNFYSLAKTINRITSTRFLSFVSHKPILIFISSLFHFISFVYLMIALNTLIFYFNTLPNNSVLLSIVFFSLFFQIQLKIETCYFYAQ